jgi:hypothetical protein
LHDNRPPCPSSTEPSPPTERPSSSSPG